ncbi:MAG: winged helix-turn-helix domain-containing protein [Anaerolineae bacterium]
MQVNNPFVYHVPVAPANFVGRERLLSLVFSQLRSPSRANIALFGPLGIGKTSLLDHIADPEIAAQWGLDSDHYLVCKVDCQSLGDFTPDLFWRRLLRCISRTAEGELQAAVSALADKDEIGFEDIQDLLDDLDWHDTILIALLDEFECVVRTDTELAERTTRHFLGMLSSLGRRTPRTFAMVVATADPLTLLDDDLGVWRGSPFPTIFLSQELSAFTMSEANELFDQALADTGVLFSDSEREIIFEQTDGHPALLQAAAHALFDAKQRGVKGKALQTVIKRAVARSRDNGAHTSSAAKGLEMDIDTGVVWVHGQRVDGLTPMEFRLLELLYKNAGRVCPKYEIWQAVWPEFEEGMADYPIQKLVSRLRQKIEPNPSQPRYILTARGRGYKYVPA